MAYLQNRTQFFRLQNRSGDKHILSIFTIEISCSPHAHLRLADPVRLLQESLSKQKHRSSQATLLNHCGSPFTVTRPIQLNVPTFCTPIALQLQL